MYCSNELFRATTFQILQIIRYLSRHEDFFRVNRFESCFFQSLDKVKTIMAATYTYYGNENSRATTFQMYLSVYFSRSFVYLSFSLFVAFVLCFFSASSFLTHIRIIYASHCALGANSFSGSLLSGDVELARGRERKRGGGQRERASGK